MESKQQPTAFLVQEQITDWTGLMMAAPPLKEAVDGPMAEPNG